MINNSYYIKVMFYIKFVTQSAIRLQILNNDILFIFITLQYKLFYISFMQLYIFETGSIIFTSSAYIYVSLIQCMAFLFYSCFYLLFTFVKAFLFLFFICCLLHTYIIIVVFCLSQPNKKNKIVLSKLTTNWEFNFTTNMFVIIKLK